MGMARAAAGLRLCVARTPTKLYFICPLPLNKYNKPYFALIE